jgi:non-ribosomal peptide synthetase component F
MRLPSMCPRNTAHLVLMSDLIHDFIFDSARRTPAPKRWSTAPRARLRRRWPRPCAAPPAPCWKPGIERGERVAVYLEKRIENVAAMFGAAAAGAVFVPVNPLLKPEQVAYILADCNVRVLVTSPSAWRSWRRLAGCPDLRTVFVVGAPANCALPASTCALGRAPALPTPACWPRARPSTPTWPPSCTPRAAPASPRAWCCRTGTWWPARAASPATWN